MNWHRAVVVGASGGIGTALVDALRVQGSETVALSRPHVDLTDEDSIARAARAVAEGGPVDLVIVASGVLAAGGSKPEKSLREIDPATFAAVLAVNTIGPTLVAKHFVPLLPRDVPSTFAVLGARVGSISDNRLGGWYSYRASKAALAMAVRTLAIELARTHPEAVFAALHPGTVATDLSTPFVRGVPPEKLFTPEQSAGHLLSVLGQLRPADSGGHFAWNGSRIEP